MGFCFSLVIIDRKYNRTNDTGRFELIHKGTPVPVPIYVGIELRVEGKTCKTGRTHHNTTKITAPVSAPPHMSSSKDVPADLQCDKAHSIGNLDDDQPDNSSSKTEEFNPPLIDHNETLSSHSTLDKIDDCQYHYHPSEKSNQLSIIRQKKTMKTKVNRITVDTLPVRQLSRSKPDSRIQSSKGK